MRITFLCTLLCVAVATSSGSLGAGRQSISISSGASLLRKERDAHNGLLKTRDPGDDKAPIDQPKISNDAGPSSFIDDDTIPGTVQNLALPYPIWKIDEDTAADRAERTLAYESSENCVLEYEVNDKGDWCEDSCVQPSNPLSVDFAQTQDPKGCQGQGFDFQYGTTYKMNDFGSPDSEISDFPEIGVYEPEPHCNPYFTIAKGYCQSFCIGDRMGMAYFLDKWQNLNEGHCNANGYQNWLRTRDVTIYYKGTDDHGAVLTGTGQEANPADAGEQG